MLNTDKLLERFQQALDQGKNFFSIEDVIERVKAKQWAWFHQDQGNCIVQVSENTLGQRILQGKFIFGDLEDTLALEDRIAEFGRSEGCTLWTMDGRPGWEKILKKRGWRTVGIIMERDL